MKLVQGDEVRLFKRPEKSIVIYPEKTMKDMPGRVIIETQEDDCIETVARKVVSAFLAGCAEIVVLLDTFEEDTQKKIIERLRRLTIDSLEDTELKYLANHPTTGEAGLLVQLVVKTDYSSGTVNLLKKLSEIHEDIVNLHRNAIRSINDFRADYADLLFKDDSRIDKAYLFVLRALKEAVVDETSMKHMGLGSLRECLAYRHIAKNLERISDHSARIGKSFCDLVHYEEGKVDTNRLEHFKKSLVLHVGFWNKIEDLSKLAISAFDDAVDSLLKRDYSNSDKVIQTVRDKKKGIVVKSRELIEEIPNLASNGFETDEICMLTQVIESIRRTAEYARGISEIALNLIFYEALLEAPKKGEYRIVPPSVVQTKAPKDVTLKH